ncbi:hypothetical protein MKX47_10570 [Solibacillus sp. FSL R7-0668]|uniref:hypothetical protein n=1 Tax=Solibacillus sp. FSL R7-0668 TaxID=2921688 RepID=UPI0030FB0B44
MKIKTFILGVIFVYLLISLPTMLGIGYVIDWVSEATLLQKFKEYVIKGLTNNDLIKILISIISSAILSLILFKRKANTSKWI